MELYTNIKNYNHAPDVGHKPTFLFLNCIFIEFNPFYISYLRKINLTVLRVLNRIFIEFNPFLYILFEKNKLDCIEMRCIACCLFLVCCALAKMKKGSIAEVMRELYSTTPQGLWQKQRSMVGWVFITPSYELSLSRRATSMGWSYMGYLHGLHVQLSTRHK